MIERTLARRYAKALLEVSEKDQTVEETEATLLALRQVYLEDPALRQVLQQPRIPRAERIALLCRPFEGGPGRGFTEFLSLLVQKKRTDLIPEIAEAFDRLADSSRGLVQVRVRTWKALDDDQRARLKEKLTGLLKKQVRIEEEIDSRLRGGICLQVGDRMIDGSVASRIKELRERLQAVACR